MESIRDPFLGSTSTGQSIMAFINACVVACLSEPRLSLAHAFGVQVPSLFRRKGPLLEI